MPDTCLARQPIVDARREVYAYELLFREQAGDDACDGKDGNRQTAAVVFRALAAIGLDRVTSGRRAFVNCTQHLLKLEDFASILPPDLIVLEVLENVEPEPALVRRLHELSDAGFRIALDDFVYEKKYEPLLEVADYVKLDVRAHGIDALRRHAGLKQSTGCQLIAEKVETYDEFRQCIDLGFDYFQGWFICRPETLHGPVAGPDRLTAIQIIARLHEPHVPIDDIVKLVALDPALSYSVVRIANSTLYARPIEVGSIREGVMRLGLTGLRRWVSIMLMAGLKHKPREVLVTAIVRARMCEELGRRLGGDLDGLFTIGLFSVLDAMFDRPLDRILRELPLSAAVTEALLHGRGLGGQVLQSVIAHERGDWEADVAPPVPHSAVADAWVEALDWSQSMLGALGFATEARRATTRHQPVNR
jgi:EAL and modified HD-GYP domain-containing signal transduction protein